LVIFQKSIWWFMLNFAHMPCSMTSTCFHIPMNRNLKLVIFISFELQTNVKKSPKWTFKWFFSCYFLGHPNSHTPLHNVEILLGLATILPMLQSIRVKVWIKEPIWLLCKGITSLLLILYTFSYKRIYEWNLLQLVTNIRIVFPMYHLFGGSNFQIVIKFSKFADLARFCILLLNLMNFLHEFLTFILFNKDNLKWFR
jgi:hypothetical protein